MVSRRERGGRRRVFFPARLIHREKNIENLSTVLCFSSSSLPIALSLVNLRSGKAGKRAAEKDARGIK